MDTSRRALSALFIVALAAGCQGRDPDSLPVPPDEPAAVGLDFEAPALSAPVLPGADVAVSIVVTNTGRALDAGELELRAAAPFSGTITVGDALAEGASVTATGDITAPARTGTFQVAFDAFIGGALLQAAVIDIDVLLTCDDGVFCNGTERLAGGACVAGFAPCDDGAPCTTDTCDEESLRCSHAVAADDCAVCSSGCVADCTDRECGDDGCGGSCGTCATAGTLCADVLGTCVDENQAGSCQNPIPLVAGNGEATAGQVVVAGDTTAGLHQVVPSCNDTSTSVEQVYVFTTTTSLGIDARSSDFDTVLHLRKDRGGGVADCLDDTPANTLLCTDDSAPPGDYGSRIAGVLEAGTWYLIVDGFDSSSYGPFTLDVRLGADSCVPQCDGKFCGGNDGCGGDCGDCEAGSSCSDDFRCVADVCDPFCDGRVCGDDGCGGSCGTCETGALCVPATGTCEVFPVCEHQQPECSGCTASQFCGTDCLCHDVNAPLPDLVLNVERLTSDMVFDTITVDAQSCSVVEQCVSGTGTRDLLRFAVEAINQGQATMVVDPPDTRPDEFSFSACHGHFHFFGFAEYSLKDDQGNVVLEGSKQAYCMEDTIRFFDGPNVGCEKLYDCDNQGIQPGWSDLYGTGLDCQWLDITGVPSGDYQLEVRLNPRQGFEEVSFANNVATVPATIP